YYFLAVPASRDAPWRGIEPVPRDSGVSWTAGAFFCGTDHDSSRNLAETAAGGGDRSLSGPFSSPHVGKLGTTQVGVLLQHHHVSEPGDRQPVDVRRRQLHGN